MNVVPLRMNSVPDATLADGCRTFMGGFPTGVVVVTTVDSEGTPWGLTCSSLISVTLTPPTLLISVHLRSGTLRAIEDNGAFAVNLLHARGRAAAEVFASGRPDRFGAVRWQPRGGRRLPWLLEDTCGFAECVLRDVRPIGDHALVCGEIEDIQYSVDTPLLYGLRQFSAWQPMRPTPIEESSCVS
jgi:flavin reductase (DIM6/NTAB) family NADH-FMN oxidoreductase RutF